MLEKEIEKKLVEEVKKRGGLCWKFTSPSIAGVPDRLCLLHEGKVAFVEVKKPGGKLRPLQVLRKEELESRGFKVFVLDNETEVERIVDEIYSL